MTIRRLDFKPRSHTNTFIGYNFRYNSQRSEEYPCCESGSLGSETGLCRRPINDHLSNSGSTSTCVITAAGTTAVTNRGHKRKGISSTSEAMSFLNPAFWLPSTLLLILVRCVLGWRGRLPISRRIQNPCQDGNIRNCRSGTSAAQFFAWLNFYLQLFFP